MGDGQGQGTIQNDDAPTLPPPGSVVISEVYGGGGNAGATYTNDFIELYNRTANAISLAGWSVQYASATGTHLAGHAADRLDPRPARTTWFKKPRARAERRHFPLPTRRAHRR